MMDTTRLALTDQIRKAAYSLHSPADYDPLLDLVGDAHFVLLGEASHGTHDFYAERAEITKRLIQEKGFTAVAVEADWPDAYRVNRYVRGHSSDASTNEALSEFQRFPSWMWRNTVVLDFVDWLRKFNDDLPTEAPKTGFYGLDLYSLQASMQSVLRFLETVDPEAAQRARYRYSCFEDFGEDSQGYGYATTFGLSESCENEAITQLIELQRKALEYRQQDGQISEDEYFYVEQNARLVKNAEAYYRSMFQGRVLSWNLRDRHMAETLDYLAQHLGRSGDPPKIVLWAHNSHLGDARATEMGDSGELNVGQLVRERYGKDAVLIGFSTYSGTVTAAVEWDGQAQFQHVQPALPDSYEALFHKVNLPRFLLPLNSQKEVSEALSMPRLERAIGVIYRPETERLSHYFSAQLSNQFDAVIHIDNTRAVEPLDQAQAPAEEIPETYPSSL
ncbi:MAG TPA: erythromycin esterase family protein [Leptolyngbyaceae cyanobacterium]